MSIKRSKAGDVRVMGLVSGNHVLEDISRDVPYGVVTTIPGELAVQSKDLWRAISQRYILLISTMAPTLQQTPSPVFSSERQYLEKQIGELSTRLSTLENENRLLREQGESQTLQKLNEIISALQQNKHVTVVNEVVRIEEKPKIKEKPEEEKVDGTAPMFFPRRIYPDDVSVRIDVQGESASSEVVGAANRLREIRKETPEEK